MGGKTKTESADPPRKPPTGQDDGIGPEGCFFLIVLIFAAIIGILHHLSRAESDGGRGLQPPSSSSVQAPVPPPAPFGRIAHFESDDPHGPPVALELHFDQYHFEYSTVDPSSFDRKQYASQRPCVIDFIKGTRDGDPNEANLIIVIGNARVTVGDLELADAMDARVRESGDRTTLSLLFNDRRQRGADATPTKKKILVVGSIKALNFGDQYDHSKLNIEYLDLAPTDRQWQQHYELKGLYKLQLDVWKDRHRSELDPEEDPYAKKEPVPAHH